MPLELNVYTLHGMASRTNVPRTVSGGPISCVDRRPRSTLEEVVVVPAVASPEALPQQCRSSLHQLALLQPQEPEEK